MIAHHLSTVRNCDTIFLLEKGRLIAKGTYDELVASGESRSGAWRNWRGGAASCLTDSSFPSSRRL